MHHFAAGSSWDELTPTLTAMHVQLRASATSNPCGRRAIGEIRSCAAGAANRATKSASGRVIETWNHTGEISRPHFTTRETIGSSTRRPTKMRYAARLNSEEDVVAVPASLDGQVLCIQSPDRAKVIQGSGGQATNS